MILIKKSVKEGFILIICSPNGEGVFFFCFFFFFFCSGGWVCCVSGEFTCLISVRRKVVIVDCITCHARQMIHGSCVRSSLG